MKNVMTAALVAGGLMFLNSPEAEAHKEVRYTHQPPPYYQFYRGAEVHRYGHMPRWLERNESFRRWYRHTSLKRDRRLGWGQLYDIYRWESRHGNRYDKRRKSRRDGRNHRH